MEVFVGIVLLLSLIGNGIQHGQVKEERAKKEQWQLVAKTNYDQWQNVVRINEGNSDVINSLKDAADKCSIKHSETLERVNNFKEVERIKDSAIRDLQQRLNNVDFGSCRVPDWVDFETLGSSMGS